MVENSFAIPVPADEEGRLLVLEEYGLVDTPRELDFNRLAALAARVLEAPVALITLVGRDRQFIKAGVGTDLCETPREVSFCTHALMSCEILIVPDATKDDRFAHNPFVIESPHIRFYAGAPLISYSGHVMGTLCVIDAKLRPDFDEGQQQTLRDIAALVMQQMEVRRLDRLRADSDRARENTERQFQLLVSHVSDYALYMLDPLGFVSSWNSGAERIKGYAADEVIGTHFSRFYTQADQTSGAPALALQAAAQEGRFEADVRHVRKNGTLFWANIVIDAIYDNDRHLVGYAKITRDITERRLNEERLHKMAHFDMLTGLLNRFAVLQRLEEIINSHSAAAVLTLDLNGFNEVNDTLGPQAGDRILVEAGNRIESAVKNRGIVGRLGGDEFAVVIPDLADPVAASEVLQTIIDAFRSPFTFGEEELHLGIRGGIAMSPNHGASPDELVANANLALHNAKSRELDGYSVFQETFRQFALARTNCLRELRRAIANGELELYYQPQVRLADRCIVGAEALLRWNHPERGVLSPAAFIHILERSSLAESVGNWAIDSACAVASRIRATGREKFFVAVNVFGAQFESGDLVSTVRKALDDHRLTPDALELEITENIILEHDELVADVLCRLREIGVLAAFDDYGTGYASLSLLKRFPLGRLKIDQTFVRHVCSDPEDASVVKAILYLANNFGLSVTAEGIEHEDHEALLRGLNCPHGQGYLYARPMPAGDLENLLTRTRNGIINRARPQESVAVRPISLAL